MVTALIFAGGTGKRMNTRSKPKQFLELHGKPIIIYTLEHFHHHEAVDNIVIVCLKNWIRALGELIEQYAIKKVSGIVPGGETGHDSIYFGLSFMAKSANEDDIVLIHDGVRPLIDADLIDRNIQAVEKYGNAITAEKARESVVHSHDGNVIDNVPPRDEMYFAKAPQSFRFGEIYELYKKARIDGIKTIDSSHLCSIYQRKMHLVMSTRNNIKITEPADYYVYRALHDAIENEQIFGL